MLIAVRKEKTNHEKQFDALSMRHINKIGQSREAKHG